MGHLLPSFLGNQTPIFLDIFHNVDLPIKTALPFRFLMRIKEALLYVMVHENRVSLKIMHLRKLKRSESVFLYVYIWTHIMYAQIVNNPFPWQNMWFLHISDMIIFFNFLEPYYYLCYNEKLACDNIQKENFVTRSPFPKELIFYCFVRRAYFSKSF